ncbi:hypothetical protein GALMADRAFT_218597 [Galerina marginata CBS 339.88]|uniref:Major facilitator superfamily (MFS) profile domain-containing protein n=1 Tax=Galerina marginata (strain CBS 339.88) TaxID=685588 RepID=A0A067TQN5_GALM3|nr:hypothetical protein GALMADRAFT_218597 [Galerina marginata CBS 339.88]
MAAARAIPTNRYAIQLAIFITFGLLFGYDIGVISGCLIMPDFVGRFGEVDGNCQHFLTSSRQSIITSLLSAWLASIWSAIFTIGVAVQTGTEFSIVQLTIGRFIAGLGVGALSGMESTRSLYNGETSPKAFRGTVLVLYQLQIIIGLFLSHVLDLATHKIPNSASWRIPAGLQLLLGLILLSGILFLPESPRHLLGTGRRVEARKVLASLNSVPADDGLVDSDELVGELDFAIRAENEGGKATWAECFSTRNNLWKRTGNGMMLQFIQQLNGQNFYWDTFFQNAGTELSPYVIQTILGGVSVVGIIPAQSLLTGALLEAACSIIAGLVGHFNLAPVGTPKDQLTKRNKQGGDTLIAFAVLHVFSFSIFWGPTPVISTHFLGESFPLRVRPKSIALGSATNWLWKFLLAFFAPGDRCKVVFGIGPMIFFGMLMFGYIYVYLFIPETRGLSLEESAGWKPHLSEQAHEKVMEDLELRDEKGSTPTSVA